MTQISDNFHKTLQRYGITNVWLSSESGVDSKMISKFRNGRSNIQIDTWEKLLNALPTDAKLYFFSLILGSSYQPNIELLVENLSSDELHDLFDLLADRIVKRSRSVAAEKLSVA